MKRSTALAMAGATLAALAALAWAFAPRPLEVETARAVEGPFEASVDEDARTRLRDRYVVSAPLAGRLARITLREGDAVTAGMPVALLTPTLSPLLDERSLRGLSARLEAARAAVERADARVAAARATAEQARGDVQRAEALARQGFVAATRIESDRLAALAAQKAQEAAEAERHVAVHEVDQARAALGAVQQRSAGAFTVRAPVAGRVLRVLQPSEASVAPGTALLEIGDMAGLEIVAELLTTEAVQLRPGQPVRIERWGGPGELQGRLRLVEPGGFTKVSALGVEEQRVRALIDLTSPPAQWQALGDGYRVGVRIVVRSEARALQLPLAAVFPRSDAAGMAVFVVDGGRARLQAVDVVARNASHAWVRPGPAAGTEVVIYPPTTLADGSRIRHRAMAR